MIDFDALCEEAGHDLRDGECDTCLSAAEDRAFEDDRERDLWGD